MDKTEQLISQYHTGFLVSILVTVLGLILLIVFWIMYYKKTGRIDWWR